LTNDQVILNVSVDEVKLCDVVVVRNIKIQWLSNEDHIIPAKDNPDGDIYAPDFYDKTGGWSIFLRVCQRILLKRKMRVEYRHANKTNNYWKPILTLGVVRIFNYFQLI
jgi:hypothetical protein